MNIIRGLHNCRPEHQNGVLTIGNFDGLHLGHQKMFEQLKAEAAKHQTHSCLMTFEPLPREYFTKQNGSGNNTARLMSRDEKSRIMTELPAAIRPDHLLYLNFNRSLASTSASAFIEEILIDTLKVQAVVIGDDFRFGCDRRGDFELLKLYGKKHGFSVTSIASHIIKQQRVSSTLVREALQENRLEDADHMLGRAYTICGHVNHGEKRGRTIGFPTANIHLKRPQTPLHGVYSVTMHSLKFGEVTGIANIGRRPTVDGEHVQLEVHLFDFEQDIYGERLCISFLHKIREEKKFNSFDELKEQIKLDCKIARKQIFGD